MLFESLKINNTLKELELSEDVKIQDSDDFAPTFLQINATLMTLNFKYKFIGSALMRFANQLQHSTTLKSLTVDIIDCDDQDIVSFLSYSACGELDYLNFSEVFSLISTPSGKKMELKNPRYFRKISRVMQLANIDLCEVAISNDSSNNILGLEFLNNSFWLRHIRSILKSLENNTKVESLFLIFDEHFIQQSCVLVQPLHNLLKENKCIRKLCLLNYVDDNLAEGLMKGLPLNRSLDYISVDVDHLSSNTVLDLLLSIELTNISVVTFSPKIELSSRDSNHWRVTTFKDHTVNFLEFFCSSVNLMRKSQIISSILSSVSEVEVDCSINETLAIALFNAFECNPGQIRVLDLSQTSVEIRNYGKNVNRALENMIIKNVSLQWLRLDDNINDSMAYGIAKGLLHNDTLQALDFNVTMLNDHALSELLQSFSKTKLRITCRDQHLQLVRIVRIFSVLQPDVCFDDSRSSLQLDELFPSLGFIHTFMQCESPTQSCVLGRTFHNLKTLPQEGLKEIEINSSKHFLSNVWVKNGIDNLLQNCKSLKVIKFCDPVTVEVIKGLSSGLRENKTLCSLVINKQGLNWSDVTPILKHLHLSVVSMLEFIKECIFYRESDNSPRWKVKLTKFSDINDYYKIYYEMHKIPHFKIDIFISNHPEEIILHLANEYYTDVTNVVHKSIATGSYHIRRLTLICHDEVEIDVKAILKSQSLKTIELVLCSQHSTNVIVKTLLLEDFKNSLVSKIELRGVISFKRSEKEWCELKEGKIVNHCEITSQWKVSIIKDKLTFFYLYISLIDTLPLKSSLCHVPLQSISCLDLSFSHLNCQELTCIFHKLQQDKNLTDINLSNCIVDVSVGLVSDMYSAFLKLLKNNTTLEEIDLTGIVNHELAKAIVSALPCCSLKSLSINMLSRFDVIEELVCAYASSGLNKLRFADVCLLLKDGVSWYVDLRDNQVHSSRQRDLFRSWSILFMLVTISKSVPSLKLSLGTQVNDGYQLQIFKMFFSSTNLLYQTNTTALFFFQAMSELHIETPHEDIVLFETVMESLEICKSLSKLCVSHYHYSLVEERLKEIYNHFILTNMSITEIDLRGFLPESIIKGIADGLPHNSTLTTLSVSLHFSVSCDMIAHLLDSFYSSRLTCLKVTDDCCIYRGQGNCCKVEFTGNKYMRSKLLCAVIKTGSCHCLRMALAPNNTLDLSDNGELFDEVLAPKTVEDGSVAELILTGNWLNSETLSLLQLKKSKLQRLELSRCNISDSLCEQIASDLTLNKSLEVLNLKSNKITVCGAQKLFKSLAHNSVLRELDLSDNDLSSNTDYLQQNSKTITLNKTLSVLHMDHCGPLCESIANGLSSGVSALTALSIFQIKEEGEIIKILRSLVDNKYLKVLDCAHSSITTNSAGAAIQQMLAHNSTLCHLDLYKCDITDEVCEFIAIGLAKNKHLKKLNLGFNKICDRGIAKLFQPLEDDQCHLEELDLSHNWQFDKDPVYISDLRNVLATNTKLKVLKIPKLFSFAEWFGKELFIGLQQNISLEKLDVSNNILDEDTSQALSTMLTQNKSITELAIQWCNFKPQLVDTSIAGAIKANTSLRRIICDSRIKTFLELDGTSTEILDAEIEDSYLYIMW